MFKKTVLLALICVSTLSYAIEGFLDRNQKDSYLLNPDRKWDITGAALYFRPGWVGGDTPSALDFAGLHFKTDYDWGLALIGDYLLTNKKDLKLEWMYYRNVRNDSEMADQPVHDVNNEGPVTVPYGYQDNFDIINLELGQWIDLRNGFLLRIHGGIELARISTAYHFNLVTNTTQTSLSENKGFDYFGVGPRVGLDLHYLITQKFSLYVKGAIAALGRTGTYKYQSSFQQRVGGVVVSRNDLTDESPLKGTSLGLDTRIGLIFLDRKISRDIKWHLGFQSIIYRQPLTQWAGLYMAGKWFGTV